MPASVATEQEFADLVTKVQALSEKVGEDLAELAGLVAKGDEAAIAEAKRLDGDILAAAKKYSDENDDSGTSAPATSSAGRVPFSTFAGATDDDKFAAANSYSAAQTLKPWIDIDRRATFNRPGVVPYTGMKWMVPGPVGVDHLEQDGGRAVQSRVTFGPNIGQGNKSFVNGEAVPADSNGKRNLYGVNVINFSGVSPTRTAQFWHGPYSKGCNLYSAQFDSMSFQAMASIFGNAADSVAMTIVSFTGKWVVNSFWPMNSDQKIANPQFHLSGSDNTFWTSGEINMESGNPPSAPSASGAHMMRLANVKKTKVANMYLTAWNGWRALEIVGGNDGNGLGLTVRDCVIEGRNAGSPGPGHQVRIEGGQVIFRDNTVNYGMASPGSAGVNTGLIEMAGGQMLIDGLHSDPANNAQGPVVSHTGGLLTLGYAANRFGTKLTHKSTGGRLIADTNYWVAA